MFIKNIKLIALSSIFITFAVFFIISKKTTCNYEYWENAKSTKQIENIKICIKEDNADAAVLLSKMYVNGDTVEKDHAKAIEIIERFAKSGNSNAMIQIGDLYSCYSKYYYPDKAEEWYKKAINNGDNYSEQAKISLAFFYKRRYFDAKDLKYIDLYMNWLENIANEGNNEAMRLLAEEYKEGTYRSKDYHISLEWLKKAALKDDVLAYRAIGNYYANGFFGNANYNEAKYWFQEAANMGDEVAARFLKDNPAPLGLEITKATVSDFKEKFKKYTKIDAPNFINGGYTYLVNPEYIALEGVKDAVAFVFDKNSILESVSITFDKDKCREVQSHLQSKYPPLIEGSKNIFTQGLTEIKLTGEYIFYSPLSSDKRNLTVCTLTYDSRAFSVRLFERKQFLIREKVVKQKQKMNGL